MDSVAPASTQVPAVIPNYRVQLLYKAAPRIPHTEEGLPVGFYRVDLLPYSQVSPQEELESLKAAYVDLSFEHGYPTLPDGRPFWQKLDFEPSFAYGAFTIYLDLIDAGPREISKLYENGELRQIVSQMRGLPNTQSVTPEELGKLVTEFSVLYGWRSRAKAYDLYKEASYRHTRLRRQMSLEDTHFTQASALLQTLQEKVFADKEFWEHMSGKTAVDMLKGLVAIQRVSVGLPAAGPLSQKETPEATTFEMILRKLGHQQAGGNVYENGVSQQQSKELLKEVLGDKENTAQLQELVIRMTRASQQVLPAGTQPARQFRGRARANQPMLEPITAEDITGLDLTGAPGAQIENLDDDSTVEGARE